MAERIQRLSFDQVIDRLLQMRKPHHENYLAMYSSWYDGIITDPALMMVPVDDHLVHRGDGIFEVFKCIGGNIYGLDRHLDRLERSAKAVSLSPAFDRAGMVEIILETIRAANVRDCVIRLFTSRGPGGFTTNPYECIASQLYVVVTSYRMAPQAKYEHGVTAKTSHIPVKKAYFANVKSCNYLPNVLMKKEAEDSGVDYTVSVDENGLLGEGATENLGIITMEGDFVIPRFDRVLYGVTVTRLIELIQRAAPEGLVRRVVEADITPEHAYGAREMMVFGTTFDVLPVVSFDGRQIGDGRPGPVFSKFLSLIREDIARGEEMLTPVRPHN